LLRVVIEEQVPVVSHSFADPTPYVAAAHAAGIKVLAQVQKVSHAKTAALAGVDIIAAQGTEAGGHTGYSGTLPLVPAFIDVVGAIPVVAAEGIADGRGLAAVLMLGAQGLGLDRALWPVPLDARRENPSSESVSVVKNCHPKWHTS
jgi:nitronate monooxygenase